MNLNEYDDSASGTISFDSRIESSPTARLTFATNRPTLTSALYPIPGPMTINISGSSLAIQKSVQKSGPPAVTLVYGPFMTNGIIRLRHQKLNGLADLLTESGYKVSMKACDLIDRLVVEMKDRQIHRANIRRLQFNTPCEADPECMKIVEVIKEATERFYNNIYEFADVASQPPIAVVPSPYGIYMGH